MAAFEIIRTGFLILCIELMTGITIAIITIATMVRNIRISARVKDRQAIIVYSVIIVIVLIVMYLCHPIDLAGYCYKEIIKELSNNGKI